MTDILIAAENQKKKLRAEIAKVDRFLRLADTLIAAGETAFPIFPVEETLPLVAPSVKLDELIPTQDEPAVDQAEAAADDHDAVADDSADEDFLAMRLREPDEVEAEEPDLPKIEAVKARRTFFRSEYVNRAIREAEAA